MPWEKGLRQVFVIFCFGVDPFLKAQFKKDMSGLAFVFSLVFTCKGILSCHSSRILKHEYSKKNPSLKDCFVIS